MGALCCKTGAGAAANGATSAPTLSINENKRKNAKRTIQMIALGVQDAGKTHAVKLLRGEPPKDLTSSVGFSAHQFNYDKGFDVGIFDVGGRPTIRNIWYNYLAECHAVMFIVNLQDMNASTIDESADLLKDLAAREDVHGKPIMLVLNRPDPDFDEITFVARMGLHEPPFNVDQRFHITRMHTYDGYLDSSKPSTAPFTVRQKKVDDPLLEGFKSFVDKVVSEFVLLDVGVAEARRRLEERIVRDKAARAARAAQREREERDREAGVQETAVDEVVTVQPHDQPGPSGLNNPVFVPDDTIVVVAPARRRPSSPEVTSPISRQFENAENDGEEPSMKDSLHPHQLPPDHGDMHHVAETGILGELSPQPQRPLPLPPSIPPTPAPLLKLSRMERIQKGLQSRKQPNEAIANGHVNTAYLPEVA